MKTQNPSPQLKKSKIQQREYIRPTVLTETSRHGHSARSIRISEYLQAILARDLDLAGLDSEIRAEDAAGYFAAAPAVAEVAAPMADEEI